MMPVHTWGEGGTGAEEEARPAPSAGHKPSCLLQHRAGHTTSKDGESNLQPVRKLRSAPPVFERLKLRETIAAN